MLDRKSDFYEVTVKDAHTGEELKLTVSWDSDVYDWGEKFKTIFQWLTFAPETVREVIISDGEEDTNPDGN